MRNAEEIKSVAIIDPSNFSPPYDQGLVKALRGMGVRVHWLGRKIRRDDPFDKDGPRPEPFYYGLSEDFRNRGFGRLALLVKLVEHATGMIRLVFFLRRNSIPIAHFQWTPLPLFDHIIISLMKVLGIEVVLTVHDTKIFHDNPTHAMQKRGWTRALRAANELIIHVDQAVDALKDMGIDAGKCTLVRHPVFDPPADQYMQEILAHHQESALGYSSHRLNFLLFGRIAPYKGIQTLIEAAELLDPAIAKQLNIVLAGKLTPELAEVPSILREKKLQDIFTLVSEFIENDKLFAMLARADAYLFPYDDIDASGAFSLALPYGKPIIATSIGIFREVLKNENNALLIEPGSAVQLKAAIELLVKDKTVRNELGNNAQCLAEGELSWSVAAKKTVAIYNRRAAYVA